MSEIVFLGFTVAPKFFARGLGEPEVAVALFAIGDRVAAEPNDREFLW